MLASCSQQRLAPDELHNLASNIVLAMPQLDKIWPGYQPSIRHFIVHDGYGNARVVASGQVNRISEFHPPQSAIPYIRNHPYQGHLVTVIEVGPGESTSALKTLFHEDFHSWQAEYFRSGSPIGKGRPAVSGRLIEYKRAEMVALAHALTDESHESSALQNYLAYRQYRESVADEQLNAVERQYERFEGTAEYVGQRAVSVILDSSDRIAVTRTARLLLAGQAMGSIDTDYLRTFSYSTGAGISWILDTYPSQWKTQVTQGSDLVELLKVEHRSIVPIPPDPNQYRSPSSSTGNNRLAYQDFLSRGRYAITVNSAGGEFTSSSLHEIDANNVLLAPADQLTLEQAFIRLRAKSRWVWIDYSENLLEIRTRKPIDLTECENNADASAWRCNGVVVTSRGIEISLSGACVELDNHTYHISNCAK